MINHELWLWLKCCALDVFYCGFSLTGHRALETCRHSVIPTSDTLPAIVRWYVWIGASACSKSISFWDSQARGHITPSHSCHTYTRTLSPTHSLTVVPRAMVDPLIFLVLVFAAGVALGSLLTMAVMIVMRAKSDNETEKRKYDSESKGNYLGPSKVWLSRAGHHFHVTGTCASLKLEGVQRRGISEFNVCQHCAKKCSETHGTENNHEDWAAWLRVSNFLIIIIVQYSSTCYSLRTLQKRSSPGTQW